MRKDIISISNSRILALNTIDNATEKKLPSRLAVEGKHSSKIICDKAIKNYSTQEHRMTVETKKIGQQYLTLASKLIEYAKKNTKSIRSLLFHYTWRSFYLFIG